VDALNLLGDVFTVAVFHADVFDQVFDGLVESNEEGQVTGNQPGSEQFVFDEAKVRRLLTTEDLAPSGAACLSLVWGHHAPALG